MSGSKESILISIKQLAEKLKLPEEIVIQKVKQIWPDKVIKTLTGEEVTIMLNSLLNDLLFQTTNANNIEIQNAQSKLPELVDAVGKLSIQDQCILSMQIQQNILKYLDKQNAVLLEQINEILRLNKQLLV